MDFDFDNFLKGPFEFEQEPELLQWSDVPSVPNVEKKEKEEFKEQPWVVTDEDKEHAVEFLDFQQPRGGEEDFMNFGMVEPSLYALQAQPPQQQSRPLELFDSPERSPKEPIISLDFDDFEVQGQEGKEEKQKGKRKDYNLDLFLENDMLIDIPENLQSSSSLSLLPVSSSSSSKSRRQPQERHLIKKQKLLQLPSSSSSSRIGIESFPRKFNNEEFKGRFSRIYDSKHVKDAMSIVGVSTIISTFYSEFIKHTKAIMLETIFYEDFNVLINMIATQTNTTIVSHIMRDNGNILVTFRSTPMYFQETLVFTPISNFDLESTVTKIKLKLSNIQCGPGNLSLYTVIFINNLKQFYSASVFYDSTDTLQYRLNTHLLSHIRPVETNVRIEDAYVPASRMSFVLSALYQIFVALWVFNIYITDAYTLNVDINFISTRYDEIYFYLTSFFQYEHEQLKNHKFYSANVVISMDQLQPLSPHSERPNMYEQYKSVIVQVKNELITFGYNKLSNILDNYVKFIDQNHGNNEAILNWLTNSENYKPVGRNLTTHIMRTLKIQDNKLVTFPLVLNDPTVQVTVDTLLSRLRNLISNPIALELDSMV